VCVRVCVLTLTCWCWCMCVYLYELESLWMPQPDVRRCPLLNMILIYVFMCKHRPDTTCNDMPKKYTSWIVLFLLARNFKQHLYLMQTVRFFKLYLFSYCSAIIVSKIQIKISSILNIRHELLVYLLVLKAINILWVTAELYRLLLMWCLFLFYSYRLSFIYASHKGWANILCNSCGRLEGRATIVK